LLDIAKRILEGSSRLPAIRMTSLCFWYEYVDVDRAFPMAIQGSDIVDHYQISLIPYCQAFTVDNNMARLVNRVLAETPYHCDIMNQSAVENRLAGYA